MPKLRFNGRALPEYAKITAPRLITGWRHEVGLEGHFVVAIREAVVTIDCDVNRLDPPHDMHLIFVEADDLARGLLSTAAFQMGGGLDLFLDTVEIDGGAPIEVRRPDNSLRSIATEAQSADDVRFIMELVKDNLTFRMALRHLNEALIAPRRAAARSAPAIDGLRSLFAPAEKSDKVGWRLLQEKLNVSERYLKVITDASKPVRHGDYTEMPGVNRTDVVHRAWQVMNRYIAYKKRGGNVALPEGEFPLLDEQ
jgi:hypothetical protein